MLQRLLMWLSKNKTILLILIFIAVGLNLLYPSHDTDLGWHLKYGEYFIKNHQLITKDFFSWTMPGYGWISISWLYDFFVYILFSKFGFIVLSLTAGFVFSLTFLVLIIPFIKTDTKTILLAAIIFISILNPMAGVGLRPQLVILLFIALINTSIYLCEKKNPKWLFLAPAVIMLWVNMHGTFILGIAQIFLYLSVKIYEIFFISGLNKSDIKKHLSVYSMVFCLSSIAVFINPQGIEIFRQILSYTPSVIAKGINEWYPIPRDSDIWLMLIVWSALVLLVIIKKRKTVMGLFWALVTLLFAYLAFSSRRMIAPYLVVTLPFFIEYISVKYKNVQFKLLDIFAQIILVALLFTGITRIPQINIGWQELCEMNLCSYKSFIYLRNNIKPDRLLNFYNFGGSMIWLDNNVKLFIDGRMDQWNKNGYSVFTDHNKIFYDDDLELFNKYNFDTVIIPQTLRLTSYLKRQTKDNKWKIKYEDDTAVIFTKNGIK